jgi:MFS family permease
MSATVPRKDGPPEDMARTEARVNSPRQVLFASLVGTAIEFFDFYIYATAAVLVFPRLFFPSADPATATLASLATFGIAFLARPIGSALFGHFGDRVGRKTTLVVALATMGISTVSIGMLPTYSSIGIAAPLLLALCRFGQGIGLGGEWGGAVLLAIENAPPGKRAWYGMFPQLGAPVGFFLSGGVFLLLSKRFAHGQAVLHLWLAAAVSGQLRAGVSGALRPHDDYRDAGVPGIAEAGRAGATANRRGFRRHFKALVAGTLLCMATFVLFYLMIVFALSWGTTALGSTGEGFWRCSFWIPAFSR